LAGVQGFDFLGFILWRWLNQALEFRWVVAPHKEELYTTGTMRTE